MGYTLDYDRIELGHYLEQLTKEELLPSRTALKKQINKRFTAISRQGIRNLSELRSALRSKAHVSEFSSECGVEPEYLCLLLNHINSMEATPMKLAVLPDTDFDAVSKLAKEGIDTTRALFEAGLTKAKRKDLAQRLDIKPKSLLELVKLSDLSRIPWAGAVCCRVMYETGIDTVAKVASTNEDLLYLRMQYVLKQLAYPIKRLRPVDAQRCVKAARQLTFDIQY